MRFLTLLGLSILAFVIACIADGNDNFRFAAMFSFIMLFTPFGWFLLVAVGCIDVCASKQTIN